MVKHVVCRENSEEKNLNPLLWKVFCQEKENTELEPGVLHHEERQLETNKSFIYKGVSGFLHKIFQVNRLVKMI